MRNRYTDLFLSILWISILGGCGDTISETGKESRTVQAYYVDEAIVDLPYRCGEREDKTDLQGTFRFVPGEICRFYLGPLDLRTIETKDLKEGDYVFESDVNVAALLQSLDTHHMYGTRIEIDDAVPDAITRLGIEKLPQTDADRQELIGKINQRLGTSYTAQDSASAIAHMKRSVISYPSDTLHLTDATASWLEETVTAGGSLSVHDWLHETRIYTSQVQTDTHGRTHTLLAWSELGMHCMDGADYSVFSLLPPYSTLKAQLIVNGPSPRIASRDVLITYEAYRKEDGTINTTSQAKTNFWQYANKLFPILGTEPLEEDKGLTGNPVQNPIPSAMEFNSSQNLFVAEGIPTVPFDDDSANDPYPMVRLVAKDSAGNVLAQTTTTLPVSDEMDCLRCHISRMDVLEKHDKNYPDAVRDHEADLTGKGFDYDPSGLKATAQSGTPILCAACHASNAIEKSGISGISSLTSAIHSAHADRNDPYTQEPLKTDETRNSCYACHPGGSTKCLRGAMGSGGEVECQSCHGTMEAVARTGREGWQDEPNCEACHQKGERYTAAVVDMSSGVFRDINYTDLNDTRFATEKTLIDPHGPRLYKFSAGHGGVACAGCHGAQHAIYPSGRPEENQQNIDLQGYAGTLRECNVCHSEGTVLSVANGPHGMHTVDQRWVDMHGTVVLREGISDCKSCHGTDLKGSPLSRTGKERTFQLGVLNRTITFAAGEQISCTRCHDAMEEKQ